MIDGITVVDAHMHVPRLSTVTSAWMQWATEFGRDSGWQDVFGPDGDPVPARLETLNLAYWRAARSGLDDQLIHPVTGRAAPAETVLRALLRHIGGALDEAEAATDRPGVSTDLLQALLERDLDKE